MKESIRLKLSLSQKLLLKGLLVGIVGSAVRLASFLAKLKRKVIETAVSQGLKLELAQATDDRRHPSTNGSPLRVHDFLFFMEAHARPGSMAQRSAEEPSVSIVIPVFNQAEFTFQCLRSLMREVNFGETEIIVVDNASTDETARMLSYFGDCVRVVRNEENLGFVDACNQGAEIARGKYLLFLNNDTEVLPGWLSSLAETLEGNPGVGATGSMFLYPGGTIQEAGGIVWKTGEASHYGWGRSPEDHRFSFARDVDFCSGASLMIRKELFDKLGGFDRRYSPAYYEDVDLCFGVRSLGFSVVYQPASRLIHHEGATAGTDTTTGFKRFQVVNREKFYEKWRNELERDQLSCSASAIEQAANRKRGLRILVCDDRTPATNADAGGARMVLILKSLAKLGHPVFVSLSRASDPAAESQLGKDGIEIASLFHLRRLLKQREFDVAILSRPDVAAGVSPMIRKLSPRTRIIFDTVDIVFRRLEREFELTGDRRVEAQATKYGKIESRLARSSHQVWVVTPADQATLERQAPTARFEIIPTIHPLNHRGKPFEERNGLVFIGNFLHRPNGDAVRYFVEQILPELRSALPGVTLSVIGGNVPPEVSRLESDDVRILGFVEDVEPLFHSARVFVAPLRFGAGMKGKIGQAMSFGLPVVTTAIGAEGMGFTAGDQVMIADTSGEFAAAVAQVYSDRATWHRLADSGYLHIEKHFSPSAVEEKLFAAIRHVIGND